MWVSAGESVAMTAMCGPGTTTTIAHRQHRTPHSCQLPRLPRTRVRGRASHVSRHTHRRKLTDVTKSLCTAARVACSVALHVCPPPVPGSSTDWTTGTGPLAERCYTRTRRAGWGGARRGGSVGRSVYPSAPSRVALRVLAAGVLAAPPGLGSTVQRRGGLGLRRACPA